MKKNIELIDVLNAVKELKEEIKTLSDRLLEYEENKLLTEAQVQKMLEWFKTKLFLDSISAKIDTNPTITMAIVDTNMS